MKAVVPGLVIKEEKICFQKLLSTPYRKEQPARNGCIATNS
jgi:hypothetical protein